MSLQINTPIITVEGIEVTNAFGRVAVVDNFDGTTLQAQVNLYTTEAAFDGGADPLRINGINVFSNTPYTRTPERVDILNIAHDDLVVVLASQGISATKNL